MYYVFVIEYIVIQFEYITVLVGMIAGYILYRVKTPPKIPVIVNLMLWSCSLGIIFIIVFGVWEGQLSLLMTSLYVSLGHSGNIELSFISMVH